VLMSLWSFQGARGLDDLAHLQSDRKPADRRLTDLSKLNSVLATRLRQAEDGPRVTTRSTLSRRAMTSDGRRTGHRRA